MKDFAVRDGSPLLFAGAHGPLGGVSAVVRWRSRAARGCFRCCSLALTGRSGVFPLLFAGAHGPLGGVSAVVRWRSRAARGCFRCCSLALTGRSGVFPLLFAGAHGPLGGVSAVVRWRSRAARAAGPRLAPREGPRKLWPTRSASWLRACAGPIRGCQPGYAARLTEIGEAYARTAQRHHRRRIIRPPTSSPAATAATPRCGTAARSRSTSIMAGSGWSPTTSRWRPWPATTRPSPTSTSPTPTTGSPIAAFAAYPGRRMCPAWGCRRSTAPSTPICAGCSTPT